MLRYSINFSLLCVSLNKQSVKADYNERALNILTINDDYMKRTVFLILSVLCVIPVFSQVMKVTGVLEDRDTKESVYMATVQLLKQDSTYVKGTLTDESGSFTLEIPSEGKYILKFSSVGYKNMTRNVIAKSDKPAIDLGRISFGADAIMLKGATVLGQAAKVTLKEDTFVYNASAYRTPEGSVVEELVKKLPGAQVDDDGKITINGKEVKKILFDGKEFMSGDTKTAMKNIPTSIIEKVKAYEEKSDLAKVTGIDDGEEETVLDFGIKKGMNKGVFGNVDLSVGTHKRYSEKLMGAAFYDKLRVMAFGNANNVNDAGFPGGGGGRFGGAQQGLNAKKMVGVNVNYDDNSKLKLDGSVRWNHSDGDVLSEQSIENYVNRSGAFSNSENHTYTRGNSYDARLRLEWKPDSMTNILFRPQFTYSQNDTRSVGQSATYNDNPYSYSDTPLSDSAIDQMAERGLMVNTRSNNSVSYSESKTAGAKLQINRKLGSTGRNITLLGNINYSDTENNSLSMSNVHLYQVKDIYGNDSTYQNNKYNYTPTKNWKTDVQLTYSEPLWKGIFLQLSYKFTYNYKKSDRATYDFSNVADDLFDNVMSAYRNWNSYLGLLSGNLSDYYDKSQSRYSEYRNYIHEMQVGLKVIRKKYNMNVGVMVQPQTSKFIQEYRSVSTDTVRNVTNVSPTFEFRYKFSKRSSLRINYRGTTSQPDMSDLLDITDDSDPLNVKKGNPGLKPSFTNTFRLFYNNYMEAHQTAVMTFINYNNVRNSVSNAVTYDAATGGRITRPENINGNWDVSAALMLNTSIDSAGVWNVNTFTTFSHNNYVGYLTQDAETVMQKNTTRTTNVGEKLSAGYRKDWLDVSLDGSFNYMNTRNLLQSSGNSNTWQFSYGANLNVYLPWNMSITTDLHENSRRGYDGGANTNELVWNAQVSQSFLKGNALSVSVQFYDILQNMSNFSRTVNAMQRSDTKYNSINSYAMLHVIYRFNLFGGKEAFKDKRGDRPRGDGDFGGGRPGGRPGGMPPGGGFGGGRPPRF